MGFVWCDNSECYGNSFTCAEPPHLLGGWAEFMYLRPQTFVYKVPSGLSPTVAVLAELMTCTASLDKIKEFSPYALEGFNSGDTMVVIRRRRFQEGREGAPLRAIRDAPSTTPP